MNIGNEHLRMPPSQQDRDQTGCGQIVGHMGVAKPDRRQPDGGQMEVTRG